MVRIVVFDCKMIFILSDGRMSDFDFIALRDSTAVSTSIMTFGHRLGSQFYDVMHMSHA